MEVPRQSPQRLFQLPTSYPLLEPAVAGLERRISFGQFTPLRPGAQHPEHTMQDGACVVPWTTTPICSAQRPQHRLHQLPTVRRSAPNGHALKQSEISKASPEYFQLGFELFMRLVLDLIVERSRTISCCFPKGTMPLFLLET